MAHVINPTDDAFSIREGGFFARLRKAYASFRQYIAIHDELNALTDAELADLGLSRVGVPDAAHRAVYGR